ncbi:MAG: HD domain-containing phosphohydrolase [Planctomycetota bacterium]
MSLTPMLDDALTKYTSPDAKLRREFVGSIQQAADLFTLFASEHRLDMLLAWQIMHRLRRHLTDDIDSAVALATQPLYDSYPVRHSVQSSLLSMALGIESGLPEDELLAMGLGALVHDVGMLLMPARLIGAEAINDRDRRELVKHPQHAVAALEQSAQAPVGSLYVAAQMHERLDGSGYPLGLHGGEIHRLSRLAMVVDAFLAMIAPRPYRPPHDPYRAVEELLFAAHRGRFDPAAVRILLRVVSLFPVGSCVWLSDGRVARVQRGNRHSVDRPVVVALDLEHDPPTLDVVDLSLRPELAIVGVGELVPNSTTSVRNSD